MSEAAGDENDAIGDFLKQPRILAKDVAPLAAAPPGATPE